MNAAVRQILLLNVGTFDFYVDSVNGSDSNSGRNAPHAFKTIAKAITAVGVAPNKRVGLARGSVFRENINSSAVKFTVAAYGSGAQPQVLGSTTTSGATWTLVSGTEYKTALTYMPENVFLVSAGVITRLTKGTAGSLTSNQWAQGTNFLNVNVGQDPTGLDIEVPILYSGSVTDPTMTGIWNPVGASDQTFKNIDSFFWPAAAAQINAPRVSIIGCTCSYSARDGIDVQGQTTRQNLIDGCTIKLNGQGRTGVAGPGDGISCHNGSGCTIQNCDIEDNDLTGIGNEGDTITVSRFNYLRNNYGNFRIYTGTKSILGSHTAYYNKIIRTAADAPSPVVTDSTLSTAYYTFTFENNTVYCETASGLNQVGNFSGGDTILRNNILAGDTNGIANFNGNASAVCTVDSDYNVYDDTTAMYRATFLPTVQGAHDVKASVLFTNAGAGDFTLQGTSPAKSAGTPLGFTRDYIGKTISATTPSIGAYE